MFSKITMLSRWAKIPNINHRLLWLYVCITFAYTISSFYGKERIHLRYLIENSRYASQELRKYFIFIPEMMIILDSITSALVFIPLTGYYGFVCLYAKFLFNSVEKRVRDLNKHCSWIPIIHSYIELIALIKSLDDYLSFSAFIIVLSGMVGLFYVNFGITYFSLGSSPYNLPLQIWFSALVCMVILSAAASNRAQLAAKEAIHSLPSKIPRYYFKLETIRGKYVGDALLTLWKIYNIDRSLFLSAIGTLLTYGMLFVTIVGHT
ncbi:uncharacterized protein TNCT_60321 [Trichonephila clavata]|uniref:Gustatory receptor n=1 Tax=Trichonephila clavata TaxID=2740835 RepID=A0A8X6GKK8_TRICU|nr:uncharacterized protein TNCT_60321 [Trichonephila clavata]